MRIFIISLSMFITFSQAFSKSKYSWSLIITNLKDDTVQKINLDDGWSKEIRLPGGYICMVNSESESERDNNRERHFLCIQGTIITGTQLECPYSKSSKWVAAQIVDGRSYPYLEAELLCSP